MKKLDLFELNRIDTTEFKKSKKLPITIILDNVRSLYNVGSVFRTSDAFRIEKIILCGITATPDNCLTEIHKTALGAEESVDWVYEKNCLETVCSLIDSGYKAIVVEQVHNSIKLGDFKVDFNKKYALIFGNEVKGVNQEIVDICSSSIEIPQYGTKHSLNVSVSVGIVLWEFAKQLKSLIE